MVNRLRPPERIADLHDKAFRNGINITEALDAASIAGSTWSRWKQHLSKPSEALLQHLDKTLDHLIAESQYPEPV